MEENNTKQNHPGSLSLLFKQLNNLGFLSRLLSIIEQISLTPQASQSPYIYSCNLKTILGLLTDQTFNPKIQKDHSRDLLISPNPTILSNPPKTPQTTKPPQSNNQPPFSPRSLQQSSNFRPSSALSSYKPQKLNSTTPEYISDFSNIKGAATFYKQGRKLDDFKTISPGPAAYSPRSETYLKRSPRAVIPNGGKRYDFLGPQTPSPMSYYPKIHFIAKQQMEKIQLEKQKLQDLKKQYSDVLQDLQTTENSTRRYLKLIKAKASLENSIKNMTEQIQEQQSKIVSFFSQFQLEPAHQNRKCNVYELEKQVWLPAQILSVNTQRQSAFVQILGYQKRVHLPASYIQLLVPPKKEDLYQNQYVEVLMLDGKWHSAQIDSFTDDSVTIWIRSQKSSYTYDSIRIKQGKRPLIQRSVFQIPDSLKIQPNDNSKIRFNKRRKVKALKKAWKEKQIEKETNEYVSNWQTFQKNLQPKFKINRKIP